MKLLEISFFDNQGPKARGAIWGINTAAESVLQASGEVLVAIPKLNGVGQPDPLRLPQTWLPINLTRNIPRDRLLASSELRTAVTNGLIGLISEDDAQKLLRQPGAREEQQRLAEQDRMIRTAGAARTISDSGAEIGRADGAKDDDEVDRSGRNKTYVIRDEEATVAEAAANGLEEAEPGISHQFKMWADRLATEKKDLTAKNMVKSRRKFTKAELGYLSRTLPRSLTMTLAMVNKNLGTSKK